MASNRAIEFASGRAPSRRRSIAGDDVSILPSTASHLVELARNLRREDREVIALVGQPQDVVRFNYQASFLSRTALLDGEVAAIWGLAAVAPQVANLWLLTTPLIEHVSFPALVRLARREVDQMLRHRRRIIGIVATSHREAILLLEVLGFTIGSPTMINGAWFRHYWQER
jgi:hypothetical protein